MSRYWMNTQTGEVFDINRQSLCGIRTKTDKEGYRWGEVLVPISAKVYHLYQEISSQMYEFQTYSLF